MFFDAFPLAAFTRKRNLEMANHVGREASECPQPIRPASLRAQTLLLALALNSPTAHVTTHAMLATQPPRKLNVMSVMGVKHVALAPPAPPTTKRFFPFARLSLSPGGAGEEAT